MKTGQYHSRNCFSCSLRPGIWHVQKTTAVWPVHLSTCKREYSVPTRQIDREGCCRSPRICKEALGLHRSSLVYAGCLINAERVRREQKDEMNDGRSQYLVHEGTGVVTTKLQTYRVTGRERAKVQEVALFRTEVWINGQDCRLIEDSRYMPSPEPLSPKSSTVLVRNTVGQLQSAWTAGPKLSAPASGGEEQLYSWHWTLTAVTRVRTAYNGRKR